MSLQQYLQKAYKAARLTTEADLRPIQRLAGTLQADSDNLILVYGGSFNPPHRGHMDVLLSALRPEVAAVGVVVLPSEDFHLRNKVAKSHPDFFLTRQRRAEIWDAIPSIPKERVWVWTSTWYPFQTVTDAVVRLARADGYNVSWANMIGPDNVVLSDPLACLPYKFDTILITNKARHVAAQFLPSGKPATWEGFKEWHRCIRRGEDEAAGPGQQEVVLWTCAGVGDGNDQKRGYYLQYARPASADINSTSLRGALLQNHRLNEESLNRLSTEALLELLAPILMEN